MPHRYSLSHDLKRFAVEFLCLLLMLQGFPAQALQTAQPATTEGPAETSETRDEDGALDTARAWVGSASESARQALDQPWTSAIGLMLGLSVYAVPQDKITAELAEEDLPAASDVTPDSPSAENTVPETPSVPSFDAPSATAQLRVATKPRPADRLAVSKVTRKARQVDAASLPPTTPFTSPKPGPAKRSNKTIAPEITTLAESLNGSPAAILRHVHDTIHYDPGHGADSPPVGTLWEGRGTAWDQAWLLQELLLAAGVDARLEWGEVEITPDLLTTLAGVDNPIRAADLLTTAGMPIVLVIGGSQVIAARMPHVWVKAHLDFIPDRGIKHGTPDQWIRMDSTLKDHPVIEGQRTDDQVFFVLADHLQSGMEKSPRQDYEENLVSHAGASDLDALKPFRTLKEERFPFVPGTLRAKILSIDGMAETIPTSMQARLDVEARDEGGATLFTYSTPLPAVYGKALELRWPGATSADQANLDLYGGIYTTPPYEIELAAELALDGAVVKTGGAIGAAEDVELTAKITPPGAVSTTARWDLFAGEHAVLGFDRGRAPQQLIDRHSQRAASATDAESQETYRLAAAGAAYLRHLGEDLDHLGALRWHRVVPLGTAVLAVQRGAVSTFPNGSPETFSRGPLSLELGAMPLGLFPADGVQVGTVRTLELLGSQASDREGDALAAIFGGEHPTAVGFLKQAVREGQTLTRVDTANLETTLAAVELGEDAEASVRDAIAQGKIAWVAESQLDINGWDTTGYVVQEPGTGLGGYFVTFERLITALDGAVTFHSPQDLDVVTAPTDVVASIDAEGLQSWTLSTRPAGSTKGTVVATGSGPVDNTLLGQFDPTLLPNGLHELILTGTDAAGQTVSGKVAVSVEGQMKIGHFTLSFIDLAIPVSGLDIEVVRTYDSRQRLEQGDFGQGWTLDIRQGSYRNNRPPGDGWQIPGTEGPWGLPCSTVQETKSHLTTVRLSDQEVYRFRLALRNPATVIGGCYADAVFEWVDGPLPGTTLEVLGTTQVFVTTGSSRAVLPDTQELFVPEDVKLTTRDGRIFHLDLADGVTHVEDLNGNFLEITPEGITHSSGKGIDFERDAEGRITRITDPMGNANRYEYDVAGDLVTLTDRIDATTRFTYTGEHYLEDIENALGVRAVRTEYDGEGRVVRMIDAAGAVVALDHQLDARRETITNRLGFVRVLEYDERGNVIRETDELGNVTVRSFDADDRLLTETDPLGNTTTSAYNTDGDLTAMTDPLGNVTRLTYDSRGNPLTITDPRGHVTTFTFDSRGNLTSSTDALGAVASFVYDVQGQLVQQTDRQGNVSTAAYSALGDLVESADATGNKVFRSHDSNGNLLSEAAMRTLPNGSDEVLVTSYSYDAMGRRNGVTFADGTTQSTSYDLVGSAVEEIDELGRRTVFHRDPHGRLAAIGHPDGTSESRAYDAEGRLITSADRLSRETHFTWDPTGGLLSTTYPDSSTVRHRYDAAQRLVSVTNEANQTTVFSYDAGGRRIGVTNSLGHETRFSYDAVDNVTEVVKPSGATTAYRYDALDQLIEVEQPDGSMLGIGYDAMGRKIRETLPDGQSMFFSYDGAGRLTTVTDPLDGVTSYAYNRLGQLARRTDALGRETRFEYDQRGRRSARIFSDGAREGWTHYPDGLFASWIQPSGSTLTFTYDAMGRLVERRRDDGSAVAFTYTASGQRESATDSRGMTQYGYDNRDRLVAVTTPEGWRIDSVYDAAGNRIEQSTTVGATVLAIRYTYDALNRLTTIVDPQGGVYGHSYDADGQRVATQFPNGVETSFFYDNVGRLRSSSTGDAAGTVLQSFAYDHDAVGRRIGVVEKDGVQRRYAFDSVGRLVTDEVFDGGGMLDYRRSFSYDAVGNRTAQETDEGGVVASIAYTYDDRDRVLEATPGWTANWTADGNLRTRTSGMSLDWDAENRLTRVIRADGTAVATAFDTDGNRVRTRVDTADGDSRTIRYLVDPTEPQTQVVAEIDETDTVLTHYVRGAGELLGLYRPANVETRYFHLDGIGSVRTLTDPAGAIQDEYTYRAFGELLDHQGSDPNPYGFAGEPLQAAIGLAYHRARWLDHGLGRFISIDPFAGRPRDPRTQHPYLYAHLDPLDNTDPTGRFGVGLTTEFAIFSVAGLIAIAPGVGAKNLIPKCRKLTPGEIALADTVFRGSIDYTKVEVCKKKFIFFQPRDTAMAPNGKIYLDPKGTLYKTDYSKEPIELQALFIHEMTHVWQHQQGINVAVKALLNRKYEYLPLVEGKKFEDYGLEQQGDIVEDYFYLLNGYLPENAPPIKVYRDLIPFVPSE